MDFPTVMQADSSPLLAQLRQALAAVSQFTPDHLLSEPHVGRALRKLSRTRLTDRYGNSKGSPTGGMHSHITYEICLPLSGRPAMETVHGVYELASPMMALLLPGMMHCERRPGLRESYSVLWINSGSVTSLASINAHNPRQQWHTAERFNIAGKPAALVNAAMPMMQADPRGQGFEHFRLAMLAVLTEIYRKALVGRTVQNQTGQLSPQHLALLNHLARFIGQHLDKPLHLEQLADIAYLSPNHLNSLFKQWSGLPLHAWIVRRRMEKALTMLQQSSKLAKQVAREVGYDDPLYFSRAFNRHFGFWPSEVKDLPRK